MVSDKGQISIPSDIRELMGIEKGDSLVLIANDNQIVIKKTKTVAKKIIDDDEKAYTKLVDEGLSEIWDNDLDARWDKY